MTTSHRPPLQTTALNIPEGMIDFGAGQPSLSLLPIEALQRAADHCLRKGNPELLAYGTEQGDGYFRRALSEFLTRRYATVVNEDHLFVTCSASQALDLICTRFTKHGDTIFVEQPTYFLALLVFRGQSEAQTALTQAIAVTVAGVLQLVWSIVTLPVTLLRRLSGSQA